MKAKYNKMQSVVKQRELGAYTLKKSIVSFTASWKDCKANHGCKSKTTLIYDKKNNKRTYKINFFAST